MFVERMAVLSEEQRLLFYEVFAYELTVTIGDVCSNESLSDADKVERVRRINEVLHRVTAKVYVLRLHTREWTEEDFGKLIRDMAGRNEGVMTEVFWAVNRSYQSVTGKEIDEFAC
jgi:hypothetical protein